MSLSPAVELLPPHCLSELSWVVQRETRSPRATSLHRPGVSLFLGRGQSRGPCTRCSQHLSFKNPLLPGGCRHHEQGTGPVNPGFHHGKTLQELGCSSCW